MAAKDLFSTRELARICGVSESTIKRWADEGLLACIKTPGGHRKFRLDALVEFAQAHNFQLESMGDLTDRQRVSVSVERLLRARSAFNLKETLLEALKAGDRFMALHLLRRAVEAEYELVRLIDEVITPTMAELGDLWARGELSIDEEHRASQIILDAIGELRSLHREPPGQPPVVLGACPPGEHHVLGLKLLLTLLAQHGWRTIDLGDNTPFENIARMAERQRPDVVLLSSTLIGDVTEFVAGFNQLSERLAQLQLRLIAGGAALTPAIRRRLKRVEFVDNAAQVLELLPATQNRPMQAAE